MITQTKEIYKIKKAKFYLPHYPEDLISNSIVTNKDYWDNRGGTLPIIDRYLPQNPVVIDIGANLGNHTLYWALEKNAKKVYSFEPYLDNFETLKTNIELNNLSDRVEIFNIGLYDETCQVKIKDFLKTNLGGTRFEKAADGEYTFRTLDSFNFKEKIDLIKIDVEHSDLKVLNGAIQTIKRNHPIVAIETFENFKVINKIMIGLGYILVAFHKNGYDYIYKYKGNPEPKIDMNKVYNIRKAKFYLPHYPVDCISSIMVNSGNYWDNWSGGALGIIDKYLKDNSTILDIGANIGSHTVYWALERNAKKIYSFEPLPDTYNILETNIKLNSLQDRVTLFNFGLSDETCKTDVSLFHESNIGGTAFAKKEDGEFVFKPLDDIEIKEKIDLIKIDVEGAEVQVLQGGKKTLTRDNPIVVLETFHHKDEVDRFMESINYVQVDTIREGEDYIYKYAG